MLSDVEEFRRKLKKRPGDIELWIELCRLSLRLGDPSVFQDLDPGIRIRSAIWARVVKHKNLMGAVLPLFGLALPAVRSTTGRWWNSNFRLGEMQEFFFDRRIGFPLEVLRQKDSAPMVLVPSGPALLMDEEGKIRRRSNVSAFLLDRYPVTVARYKLFLEDTGHRHPLHWEQQLTRPHRPVVFVSRPDANRYAHWADARLIGILGWEKAARGTGGSQTPWAGDGKASARANLAGEGPRSSSDWDLFLEEVGVRPDGISPFGIEDMAGNIFEWGNRIDREDFRFSLDSYAAMQLSSAWNTDPTEDLLSQTKINPDTRRGDLGFRLGKPLQEMIRSVDLLEAEN